MAEGEELDEELIYFSSIAKELKAKKLDESQKMVIHRKQIYVTRNERLQEKKFSNMTIK